MPIQDLNVEKHTNLLIRTVVKLLNVLLNRRLGSSLSCTHPGLISIAALGPIRSSPNMNLGSQDHNSNFLFLFFCFNIKTLFIAKKDNLTSAAPDRPVTSFEIVYGFGWSADHTNC